MKKNGELILLLTSIIFGFSFVFQKIASNYVGPFTVNFTRFLIGAILLLPLFVKKDNSNKKDLWIGGILMGITVFLASYFQQVPMVDTKVGKIGFITGLYIVFVPIINTLLFNKKLPKQAIIALFICVFGLFILCDLSIVDLSIRKHDYFLLLSAFIFAFQIIIMDRYVNKVNPFKLSWVSYLTVFILNFICFLLFEEKNTVNYQLAFPSMLFLGIFPTAIAYTLQAIGQKRVDASPAALLMSLETVFSTIGGALMLNQLLTSKELIGCILMFIGVLFCQIKRK